LGVPVLLMNSETESTNYRPIRQPDSAHFRFWEVAGAAHGCAAGSKFMTSSWPRDLGLDGHPMAPKAGNNVLTHEPVNSAGLAHLQRWLTDGTPPPTQPRLVFEGDPPRLKRDANGIAEGGIRLPQIAVPTATHTGVDADGVLQMFGTTTPFDNATLHRLYASPEDYARKFKAAADAAVAAGFLLPVDAEALVRAVGSS
jgi:hypothetical protein